MKRIFISLILVMAFTFGCTKKKAESNEHTHEDGTTHEDHAPDVPIEQEEFEVGEDTTAKESHSHGEDGDHQH
ncbi:MAG: hypothetical protein WD426_15135 [Anditalea sp.]